MKNTRVPQNKLRGKKVGNIMGIPQKHTKPQDMHKSLTAIAILLIRNKRQTFNGF